MSQLIRPIKGTINVITGCASGLGKATMLWFLKQGCGPILAIDRRFDDGFVESLDLTTDQKSRVVVRKHDTFDENVESSLKEFVSAHGTIDNLINVAGVALAYTFLVVPKDGSKTKSYDLKHAQDLVQFNTLGTFNMIRLVSSYMIDEESKKNPDLRPKCIINTSCISTSKPSVGQSAYSGSKSSIDSMTLCIAREFSPLNIRCNTINVGYFDTPLLQGSTSLVTEYLERAVVLCPRRLGHPNEFAHLAQTIVENQMLNGACIKLDACSEPAQARPHGGKSREI